MQKFLSSVIILASLFTSSLPALAQTDLSQKDAPALSPEEEAKLFPPLPASTNIPNTTNCFDDYRFGSVQADVSPSVLSTVPGVPLTFSGQITNDNPYPIVDGAVYVKIFQKQTDDLNSHQNGPLLVDQFFAKENLSLKANSSSPFLFVWNIPRNAETGDYQAATYFVSAKRFNLSGLSFTDDVTGNKADFSIKSDVTNPPVSFNKNTVTLNQKPHKFAIFPLHFAKDENVTAEVELINPSKQDKTIALTWQLYQWDGLRQENQKDAKTETITLKGSETKKVSYTVSKDTGSVAYLVAEAKDGASKSILDIRFVREGSDEIRLNFPSITSYPLTQGKETSLFSCVHSTNSPIVKDNTLTLTLKTLSGEIIHSYTYNGDISGEMMGVKELFTPKETIQDFTLTATLKHNNQTVEEVTQTYSCNKLGENCSKENSALSSTTNNLFGSEENSLWLRLGLFLLGAIILFFIIRRIVMRRSTMSIFLGFLVAGSLIMGVGGVRTVEADNRNPVVNVRVNKDLLYRNRYTGDGVFYAGWSLGLRNPNIAIQYHVNVTDTLNSTIPDGANIPVGSRLKFSFTSYGNMDIFWSGTGYSSDTPYGRWIEGAKSPTKVLGLSSGQLIREKNTCDQYDYVNIDVVYNFFPVHIPLSVNPPTKSFTGSANLDCGEIKDNNTSGLSSVSCTVIVTGAISASLKFEDTRAKFYYRYYDSRVRVAGYTVAPGCYGNNVPMNPNGRIDYVKAPEVTGPISGQTNTSYSFIAFSRDFDDNIVRYGFDWDNNGIRDEWTDFTTSSQTVSHLWPTTGAKKFSVVAQDKDGKNSIMTVFSINIISPPPSPAPSSIITVYPTSSPTPQDYFVPIPSKTINLSFTAVPGNNPPSAPLVTGPTEGTLNTLYPFNAASTDPEGDPVRYEFNWNNDGTTISPMPSDGITWVTSCLSSPPLTLENMSACQVTSSYSWIPPASSKTFQVRARDNKSGVSGWTSHTIRMVGSPLVDLKINGSDGPINLTQGQTRNFTWTTTDATSCTASSNDIWSGSKAVPSGAESLVAHVSSQSPDHDKLTCTGPGGTSSDSVQVNVACVPSTGAWEACLCPEEIKWRTNIGADCRSSREQGECTSSEKNSCRDFNWREVAP